MVPARFHELRDRTLAAVDRALAEPVRLSPMKDGDSDADRPQHVFEAVLRTGDGQVSDAAGAAGSTSQERKLRFAASPGQLHIDRATYQGPAIMEGDKVRALARAGEPLWEVFAVDDRSHARLVLHLGEV
jgi:hypothetical protein